MRAWHLAVQAPPYPARALPPSPANPSTRILQVCETGALPAQPLPESHSLPTAHMLTTLLLAAAAAPQVQDSQATVQSESLVRVNVSTEGQLERLLRLGLDIPHVHPGAQEAQVLADSQDLARLRRLGIEYEVLVHDLEAWYAARLANGNQTFQAGSGYGSGLTPAFGQGSMGGYWTNDEVSSVLDQIAASYPAIVAPKQSLGTTIEGRPIWMLKVSDNPGTDEQEPEIRVDSLHHAREPQGMQASLWFLLYLVEEYGSDPLATYLGACRA